MDDATTAQILINLSETEFVLHGSPDHFSVAEPRQAYCDSGLAYRNLCAVYASIEIYGPLIKALIRGNVGWRHTRTYVEVLGDRLTFTDGYVYVFRQEQFTQLENRLWFASLKPVRPERVIPVRASLLRSFSEIKLPPALSLAPTAR